MTKPPTPRTKARRRPEIVARHAIRRNHRAREFAGMRRSAASESDDGATTAAWFTLGAAWGNRIAYPRAWARRRVESAALVLAYEPPHWTTVESEAEPHRVRITVSCAFSRSNTIFYVP